mmetsp:Transcript_70436/g.170479  ORF Transcript_70436/g.170479 Transcript_70436/m.170479 type:complete len:210 (+) Transcript_70436:125-754(+)
MASEDAPLCTRRPRPTRPLPDPADQEEPSDKRRGCPKPCERCRWLRPRVRCCGASLLDLVHDTTTGSTMTSTAAASCGGNPLNTCAIQAVVGLELGCADRAQHTSLCLLQRPESTEQNAAALVRWCLAPRPVAMHQALLQEPCCTHRNLCRDAVPILPLREVLHCECRHWQSVTEGPRFACSPLRICLPRHVERPRADAHAMTLVGSTL